MGPHLRPIATENGHSQPEPADPAISAFGTHSHAAPGSGRAAGSANPVGCPTSDHSALAGILRRGVPWGREGTGDKAGSPRKSSTGSPEKLRTKRAHGVADSTAPSLEAR